MLHFTSLSTSSFFFFFFNDTATTEIYTLSLHDALPISWQSGRNPEAFRIDILLAQHDLSAKSAPDCTHRSEEHTSELQSHHDLVCRLLLEKKKREQREIATSRHNNYYKRTNQETRIDDS